MRKAVVILIALLAIVNIPIMLGSDKGLVAAAPVDITGLNTLFYDDFESGLGAWTVTGNVWSSTNYSSHGTTSVLVSSGHMNRTFGSGQNDNVLVRVNMLDKALANPTWAELSVRNATTTVRVGVMYDSANEVYLTTYIGNQGTGQIVRLPVQREIGNWQTLGIYLNASKATLIAGDDTMYMLNLTNPTGYGFNSSAWAGIGLPTAHPVYIDEFAVYRMHQSSVFNLSTPAPLTAVDAAWKSTLILGPTVIHNASAGKYWLYYYGLGGVTGLGKMNSSDGITWDVGNNSWIRSAHCTYGSVVQGPNLIKLFYFEDDGMGSSVVWIANSTDGVNFTDDHMVLAGGGHITTYGIFAWYEPGAGYRMMYNMFTGTYYDWGVATSTDGETWITNPANPVFTIAANGVSAFGRPYVNQTAGTYYMLMDGYYQNTSVITQPSSALYMFKSTDLVNWTNATIHMPIVSGEWKRPMYGGGNVKGVYYFDPFYMTVGSSRYLFYIRGNHNAGAQWLVQADSLYTLDKIGDGHIDQWGSTMFAGTSNNVTAAGEYWHYGINEFNGTAQPGFMITPTIGPVNVTISAYQPGAYNESDNGAWLTANQTPAGAVQFLMLLRSLTTYVVLKDGSEYTRFTTNTTGWHSYVYSGAWSSHSFAFRVTYMGVSGIDWTFPAVADSATLRRDGVTYPPVTTTIVVPPTSTQEMMVGQWAYIPPAWYLQYRTYLSFNTSALPDTATVLSAELRLMLRTDQTPHKDFNVLVYGSNFTNLAVGDWGMYSDYQGVLMSSAGAVINTWYDMPISTDQINLTGKSQFMMRSSQEGTIPDPGYERLRFWNMTSAYHPALVVKIQVLGTVLALETDAGVWYNSSVFPEVQDWNLTYDLLYFSFSTIPNTRNATLFKQSSSWNIEGVTPACNYTDNSTQTRFEDLFDSITYRAWYTAPKAYAYSLVHIALYDSFTGTGLFWEQMRVLVSDGDVYDPATARTVSNPDIYLNAQKNFTFTVTDYFNNLVTNYSIYTSATTFDVYIPVPIYSYKFYNQNPTFALLRVHYNLTGAPYSEFIPPYDSVNRYLKAGTYRFNITFYNATGYAGNTYTWVRTIPSSTFPGAGFVILEGDTISEAIAAANGVKAVVLVIADLVTPDLIWVGIHLPQIPAYLMTVPDSVVFNNRYLVDADITQTRTGWFLNFSTPIPGNVTVSTLISDDFTFVGNLSTQIYVNTTSATVYSNANLPAGISLSGGTYMIWTNRTISVVRDCHFRWQRTFTYLYFPATDLYQTELTFQNDVGIQWRNLTMFIPFQNNSKVNNGTVKIYDMNNTVYLAEGANYVLSRTGIHMWFANWNASLWRGFRVTYTTVNESEFAIPATVTVTQLGDGTAVTQVWQGDTFYFAVASWTNAYREDYTGPLYITLDLSVSVDPTTVVVLGESGIVVTTAVVFGNTVAIPEIHLDVGEKVTYTILFKTPSAKSPMDLNFAGIPVLFVAIAVMLVAFVLGLVFYVFQKDERMKQFGRMLLGIAVLAMGFIAVVIIYFIVTT